MKITTQMQSKIVTKEQETNYIIGSDILSTLHELEYVKQLNARSFLLLTDSSIYPLLGEKVIQSLQKLGKPVISSIIQPREQSKSLYEMPNIIKPYFNHEFDRSSILVALGGGVVTDLGGFLASILLRGIGYINIPTTLLGLIDASIGGKTGVDFWLDGKTMYKNMLGRIEQPQLVISDVDTLSTLPERERKSGLGEMVKYWAGWGKPEVSVMLNSFQHLHLSQSIQKIPKQVRDDMLQTIAVCQQIKIDTIQEDPYETKGIRDRLNLGHTIGHGIEGAAHGELSHGEAVAIGLVAAARLSVLVGYLREDVYNEIKSTVESLGLPSSAKRLKKDDIEEAMKMDKKAGTFVLLQDIGKLETKVRVEQKYIEQAIDEIM